MGETRKITVEVPEDLLAAAQAYTGEGITETVRAGLRRLASIRAQQQALKLRGKVRFSLSLDELRHDRE
jgi:Arc/MetJ-type ribon-helix-helix transcriptional regulator